MADVFLLQPGNGLQQLLVLLTVGYQLLCAALLGTAVLSLAQFLKKTLPSIAAGALLFLAPVLLSWLTVLEQSGWFAVPLTGGALLPFVRPLLILISPLSMLQDISAGWLISKEPIFGQLPDVQRSVPCLVIGF